MAESCSAIRSVEDGNLALASPPGLATGNDLANLPGDVLLFDQPLPQRDVDFSVSPALPDVVDKDPSALQDFGSSS